jgi:NTE family protein
MGNDFMARRRVDEIVQQAFLNSGAYASRPDVRKLLARLRQG